MSTSPTQVSYNFLYQSYFDATLLETAVLSQGAGQLLVDVATAPAQNNDNKGVGIALDPSSETPIAISFRSEGHFAPAIILRPGQIIFPYGRAGKFDGFKWSIPFGWLGGGRASLLVLPSQDVDLDWVNPMHQLVFHRQTMAIQSKAVDLSALTINPNWPLRFPSPGTRRTTAAGPVAQANSPTLTVSPTQTLIRLIPAAPLDKPSTVRFLFFETKEFDLNSSGTPVATDVTFEDVTFGVDGVAGTNSPMQCPLKTYKDGILVSLGTDPSAAGQTGIGVVAVDLGDGDDLSAAVLQIVRYGRL